MIRRWALPLIFGVVLALVAYQVALIETPAALMALAVRRVAQGGVNRFTHAPLATAASRAIVRPSPDLAYSSCPYDLGGGPLAITVQPVPARYWSLSVFDGHTNAAFVRNNLQANGGPMRLYVALPGQATPAGVDVARVPDRRGIALIRILVDDRAAFPAIDAARRASTCGAAG